MVVVVVVVVVVIEDEEDNEDEDEDDDEYDDVDDDNDNGDDKVAVEVLRASRIAVFHAPDRARKTAAASRRAAAVSTTAHSTVCMHESTDGRSASCSRTRRPTWGGAPSASLRATSVVTAAAAVTLVEETFSDMVWGDGYDDGDDDGGGSGSVVVGVEACG